jgi:hypothetical protein
MTEQRAIRDFATAFKLLDQHKRELRSKTKRVRARAQRREREIKRLDREITAALAGTT